LVGVARRVVIKKKQGRHLFASEGGETPDAGETGGEKDNFEELGESAKRVGGEPS